MNLETKPAALQAQVSGSSFYAGMRVLPKPEREAMYAVYAFCRAVDDIADDHGGDRRARAEALCAWREDISALYAGREPGRAVLVADAMRSFGLAKADFDAVIDGMAMDVDGDIRWPPAATLDLYCDRVASAVGRLSVRIFGMDAEPGLLLARHLGRALQLTNILRDIDEDAETGRVYLPREALEDAGIALTTPREVIADPRVDTACRAVARDARAHFVAAGSILAQRPRGRLIAPRLMASVYSGLLTRMEAAGWAPPRARVRTSKAAVLWTVLRLGLTR
jgi:phytoene synthase